MEHVNGFDVSDYQPGIQWDQARAAGYSFAIAKATEGVRNVQDTFAANIERGRAAGMTMGAYHFMRWDLDPAAQAAYFLDIYDPRNGDLPPTLDCEGAVGYDAASAVQHISTWLHAVEAKTKTRCLLYMGYYFWKDALGSTLDFAGHPLWLAQYSSDSTPQAPEGWAAKLWQYSDAGDVDGVPGAVDLDRFLGSVDDLRSFTLKGQDE